MIYEIFVIAMEIYIKYFVISIKMKMKMKNEKDFSISNVLSYALKIS